MARGRRGGLTRLTGGAAALVRWSSSAVVAGEVVPNWRGIHRWLQQTLGYRWGYSAHHEDTRGDTARGGLRPPDTSSDILSELLKTAGKPVQGPSRPTQWRPTHKTHVT